MAYIGTKTGAEVIAKQLLNQAAINRENAVALIGDEDLPNESKRLLAEAKRLEGQAKDILA